MANRKAPTAPPPPASDMPAWVKMLTGLSGPDFAVGPGDVLSFDAAEAGRLVEAGFAEYTDAPEVDTAA